VASVQGEDGAGGEAVGQDDERSISQADLLIGVSGDHTSGALDVVGFETYDIRMPGPNGSVARRQSRRRCRTSRRACAWRRDLKGFGRQASQHLSRARLSNVFPSELLTPQLAEEFEAFDQKRPQDFDGSDVSIVTARQAEPGEVPARVQVYRPDGRQARLPIGVECYDPATRVIDLEALVAWLGVDPSASSRSAKDGFGALVELRKRKIDMSVRLPDDPTIKLPLVEPGGFPGVQTTGWSLGLQPDWGPYVTFGLGRWTSDARVPEVVMRSAILRPPPLPEVGDTDAWPDTVEDWLADLDARLRANPQMTAAEYRAHYMGYDYDLEDFDDPLDPALEEALRIRNVPGAHPPPEPLPPARRPEGDAGEQVDVSSLPVMPIDNRVAILDRPDAMDLVVPFAGDPDAVRRAWEELVRAYRVANPYYERSGGIGGFTGWVIAGMVAALIALIFMALLLVGVFSDDGGTDDADPPAATAGADVGGSGQVGAVPLDEYADGVCEILAEEVQTGSEAFGAALDASQGAQPATAEEFDQLFADLETGARELAAGLTAAADRLDGSPPPDVAGGTGANQGAAATYREAAGTATAIADTVAGFDAANATPAETEAFAADVNVLIGELGVLGTEFESNPEIAEAVRQSQVCAEAEAAATGD
jgi:hypothetical protein